MNTKRIIFWVCFAIILILIVWGLIVAMGKPVTQTGISGTAPEVTAVDHVAGATSTSVSTLIEYSDFQCPACKSYYPLVEKLMSEASTTVRLVYRHYPLPQHQNALLAARASEAASLQGKFWDMYRLLFENQETWDELSDTSARNVFSGYAEQLSLDLTRYAADLDSAAVKSRISADQDAAQAIGVNSTPTFFVNGKAVVTPSTYDQFKALVTASATTSTP